MLSMECAVSRTAVLQRELVLTGWSMAGILPFSRDQSFLGELLKKEAVVCCGGGGECQNDVEIGLVAWMTETRQRRSH